MRQASFNRSSSIVAGKERTVSNHLTALQNDYEQMNYEIHEDAQGNVFVKDLALIPVSSTDDVHAIINLGLRLRATHETKINQVHP